MKPELQLAGHGLQQNEGEEAVQSLIRLIGEDPTRDGLIDTPRRVLKAMREMTAGYDEDPEEILSKTFEETSDELIVGRRLQIQERLTRQIADAIQLYLRARGTGVIIRAHHLCMGCRGVKLPGTELVTSAMLGTLRDDAVTRAEFLRLCGGA